MIDENDRAKHIYLTLGFKEEGRLRRAAFTNGAARDVLVMGLLRGEFRRSSKNSPPSR